MIKRNWVYLLFFLSVAFFLFTYFGHKEEGDGKIHITTKTFRTNNGWGYDILINDTIFIHQETIPAIEGRKNFRSEQEAKEIGELAVSKMKHSRLPEISLNELDSCGIEH